MINPVLAVRGQIGGVLAAGGGGALPWWNPDGATPGGVGGTCVGAYQAKGAASYAASLVNLANPGTNDLIEGNGAVPWNTLTGWGFVAAALQYFYNIGLIPDIDQSQSVLVQFANVTLGGYLFGVRTGGRHFSINNNAGYLNSGTVNQPPVAVDGNLAVAGNQGYRNGTADGGAIPNTWISAAHTPFIGAFSNGGVPTSYPTFDCYAVAVYNIVLTAAQVLARANTIAAL